jgi:hypothetical protein
MCFRGAVFLAVFLVLVRFVCLAVFFSETRAAARSADPVFLEPAALGVIFLSTIPGFLLPSRGPSCGPLPFDTRILSYRLLAVGGPRHAVRVSFVTEADVTRSGREV